MNIKFYTPLQYFITAVILLCFFLSLTLWLFFAAVPDKPRISKGEAQTAIILTGSQDRLEAGMQLLRSGQVDSLFISGVYPKLRLSELFHALQESPEACGDQSLGKNCIELGRKATNTKQNACESMEWIKNNNIKQFYLITSDYHYPRSHAEFVAILRQNDYEAVILPYITAPRPDIQTDSQFESLKDWSSEYVKWLIVKSRIFLEKFLPKSSIINCYQ